MNLVRGTLFQIAMSDAGGCVAAIEGSEKRCLVASTHWWYCREFVIMAEASLWSCAGDDDDLSPIQIASTVARMPCVRGLTRSCRKRDFS